MTPRVDTEVGPLRSVVLHRPGPELQRLTPRNADRLLFDGIPWVERAQLEHDRFAATLRSRGVEVLLLTDLLVEALHDEAARTSGIADAVDERILGLELGAAVRGQLAGLAPAELADALTGGLTFRELGDGEHSLVRRMHGPDDFAVDPLPNLMFTRDSSMRVGERVVAAVMGMPARRREASLVALAHAGRPALGGVAHTDPRDPSPVEGGDVLLLAPRGAGHRGRRADEPGRRRVVRPRDVRRRARPHRPRRPDHPASRDDAPRHGRDDGRRRRHGGVPRRPRRARGLDDHPGPAHLRPRAVPAAAARAMGIDELRALDTGPAGVAAEREQWDDGNNTLALAPGVVVAYERNTTTNERMRDAGIEVVTIEGFELGSGRGGPRCLSCPWERDLPSAVALR